MRAIATDSAGATASDTSGPFSVVYILTLNTTFLNGWNMFSIPLNAVDTDFAVVLLDDIDPLFIFWYNPATGGYQMWDVSSPIYDAELGKGYWTKVNGNTSVDVEGFPAADAPFSIILLEGWNMIGDPFSYSVDWGDVIVYNSATGETVDILTAHDNGWVLKFMYKYDPAVGGYVMSTAPDGQLDPWWGYWVRALVDAELIIPNTPMP